jgi:hypothetical protein
MSEKIIAVDGSGNTGCQIYWEPDEMTKDSLASALNVIGKSHLIPKSSTVAAALEESFDSLLSSSKIKQRGKPIKYFRLAAEVTGFEARQIHPNSEDVDPIPVASVVVEDGTVKIAKHNPDLLPQLDNHRAEIERVLQSKFEYRMNFYPTATVSACIAKVISDVGGILIRRTGGLYFVPEKGIPVLEEFASVVDLSQGAKPEIVLCKFPLVPTERSFLTVLKSVKSVAKERLDAVEASLSELGKGRKMRDDGKQSRLDECQEVLEMLELYEEILGVPLDEFKSVAEKVKGAINAHAALEWCS